MASEFPGQHASARTPVATRQESNVEPFLPDSSSTVGPRQERVASYTTTQIGGNVSSPQNLRSQARESSVQQPEIRVAQPSPSDLEHGMGDLTSSADTPGVVASNFAPLKQPASILLPPETFPVVYEGTSNGYYAFPAVDWYPGRQRQDPFSSSQEGSPHLQLHPILPPAGSQNRSPVERYASPGTSWARYDAEIK